MKIGTLLSSCHLLASTIYTISVYMQCVHHIEANGRENRIRSVLLDPIMCILCAVRCLSSTFGCEQVSHWIDYIINFDYHQEELGAEKTCRSPPDLCDLLVCRRISGVYIQFNYKIHVFICIGVRCAHARVNLNSTYELRSVAHYSKHSEVIIGWFCIYKMNCECGESKS